MTALDSVVVYCLMLLESKKKLEYTDPLKLQNWNPGKDVFM